MGHGPSRGDGSRRKGSGWTRGDAEAGAVSTVVRSVPNTSAQSGTGSALFRARILPAGAVAVPDYALHPRLPDLTLGGHRSPSHLRAAAPECSDAADLGGADRPIKPPPADSDLACGTGHLHDRTALRDLAGDSAP